MNKRIIGITDCEKFDKYNHWISEIPGVVVVRLGDSFKNLQALKGCHGVVLTGGEDVHPRFYDKPEYLEFCHQEDMNEARDEFELNVINYSQQHNLPLLGICRGLQIANVYFGGSLIPDIPRWYQLEHSKYSEGNDRYHPITVEPHSQLYADTNVAEGEVNSAHHQCVERVGAGLKINCYADGKIVEGLERAAADQAFLLLVQWHPERMKDQQNVFTKNIRRAFIDQVSSK